jgi:hypothetical protein
VGALQIERRSSSDPVDVNLRQQFFLDDMGMSFNKGDEVAFTGSKVTESGADLILAGGRW